MKFIIGDLRQEGYDIEIDNQFVWFISDAFEDVILSIEKFILKGDIGGVINTSIDDNEGMWIDKNKVLFIHSGIESGLSDNILLKVFFDRRENEWFVATQGYQYRYRSVI